MRVVLTLIARGQTKMRVDGESVDKCLYESCLDSHTSRSNEDES